MGRDSLGWVGMKIGIQVEPQLGFTYQTVAEIAIAAESLGFDGLWSSDHFFLDEKSEARNCLEAWSLLAALAVKTKKLHLGPLVSCVSYRHPAILAKIAATVDMISNGRLILGIGAGWKELEYKAYGIPFPSVKERLDRLEESIQIIKLLWTKPVSDFQGKYYTLQKAFSAPKPLQQPMPPILVGGSGERRTLKIVAQHADYCNLFFNSELSHKLEVLQQHCAAIGRDFDEIKRSVFGGWPGVYVSNSPSAIKNQIHKFAKEREISDQEMTKKVQDGGPGSWIGTPDELIERFHYLTGLGIEYTHLVFPGHSEDTLKAIETFAELVLPSI